MGFDLSQLVQRYLRSLAPHTEIRDVDPDDPMIFTDILVPISLRYDRIMNLLENKSESMKAHKEELLGSSTDMRNTDLFSLIGYGQDLSENYYEFMQIPIQERAKMIAYHILDNMAQLVQRHDGIIRRNTAKALDKKG